MDNTLPEASFANVAASTVDSGEALENRNDGFGKPLRISLSQYRFRNAFGVNGFLSPATSSPAEITVIDEKRKKKQIRLSGLFIILMLFCLKE